MPSVLIAFASIHGHTAKIAERIADRLHEQGDVTRLCDLRTAQDAGLAGADAVIVAASVHRGEHQAEVTDWVRANRAELEQRPTAFLSVSLTAAEDTDESRAVTQGLIDAFVEATGWTPARALSVAGALQYREYDVFTRTLMRLLMKRGGHPTDASHDYDYTDWPAVDAFAVEFAAQVATTGATAGA